MIHPIISPLPDTSDSETSDSGGTKNRPQRDRNSEFGDWRYGANSFCFAEGAEFLRVFCRESHLYPTGHLHEYSVINTTNDTKFPQTSLGYWGNPYKN